MKERKLIVPVAKSSQIMHTMLSYVVKVDKRDKFYLTILTCCGHSDDICPPKNEQVQLTCLLLKFVDTSLKVKEEVPHLLATTLSYVLYPTPIQPPAVFQAQIPNICDLQYRNLLMLL